MDRETATLGESLCGQRDSNTVGEGLCGQRDTVGEGLCGQRDNNTVGEGLCGQRDTGTNERTNEFFINEGKGISTILFFIQPSGKTKSTKTIENKIIINSKTHINY